MIDLRDLTKDRDAFDRAFPSCRFEVLSFDRNGVSHRLKPLVRQQLRESIKKARARRGSVRVKVHDITERNLRLGFEPAPRSVVKS